MDLKFALAIFDWLLGLAVWLLPRRFLQNETNPLCPGMDWRYDYTSGQRTAGHYFTRWQD
jgi:hypothetical protein